MVQLGELCLCNWKRGSPHNIHIYFMCWFAISYRCSNCNCVLATITILCLVNWHSYILKGSSVAISNAKEFQKKDIIFFSYFSGRVDNPIFLRDPEGGSSTKHIFLIIWYVAKYWPKILFEIIFWPAQFHNPFRSTLYII